MRRLARPLLFTSVAVIALAVFISARSWTAQPVNVSDLSGWLNAADSVDVLAELARLLGIVLAGYVASVSGVALMAETAALLRMPRLTRALRGVVQVVAVPALRKRLLEVAAVATVTASSLHAIPASAAAPMPRAPAAAWASVSTRPLASMPAVLLGGEYEGFDLPATVLPSALVGAESYIVQTSDTLWGILEQHYGRADIRLLDTVVDANPQIHDPNLILAGWTLVLPEVASTPATVDPTVGVPAAPVEQSADATWTVVTVEPGDTLWGIVDRHYGGATSDLVWEVVEINPTISEPNLIFPGQQITLHSRHADAPPTADAEPPTAPPSQEGDVAPLPPPTSVTSPTDAVAAPAPGPESPTTAAPPSVSTPPTTTIVTTQVATAPPAHEQPQPSDGAGENEEESLPSIATIVGWSGAGALAAGLLLMAKRRRRGQAVEIRHARRSQQAINVGVALHETENVSVAERAAVALRLLGARISFLPGEPSPVPRLLRVSDAGVELVWDTPNASVVDSWRSADGGWSWNLDPVGAGEPTDSPGPCPALVTIGKRDGADVLLNLEACGVLALTGVGARDAARSLASELACSVFADSPTVLVIGDITLAGDPGHARAVAPSEACGWLRDRSESASALLAGRRLTSLFALRARAKPLDAHEPVVVVVDAERIDAATLAELTELAHGDLGAVVVVVGADDCSEWKLSVNPDSVRLEPLGLDLDAVTMTEEFAQNADAFIPARDPELDESVDDAWDDEAVEEEFALADHLDVARLHVRAVPVRVPEDVEETVEPGWDVELKVLGQVRAIGTKEPLTPTELHLAIYLAFNRNGENADTIATMLWPNGVSPRTLTNAMASLRRKLGTGSDGQPLFPLGRDRQYTYRLSERVVTDWDRFVELIGRADAAGDDALAVALLDEALGLVDGPPFRAATGYSWAYGDGSATLISDTVEATARSAAHLHESAGDDAGAALARFRLSRVRGEEAGGEPEARHRPLNLDLAERLGR